MASLPQLYWWRSRLGQGRASSDLVPVEIVEHDVSVEPRRTTGVDFQVHLESGATVHVPAGFDEGDLRRLVRALRC